MKAKRIFIACILMCTLMLVSQSTLASESDKLPFTLQLDESNGDLSDYMDIVFDPKDIVGTHIGIKLNVEHAVDQNGNTPIWNMLRFEFYDTDDKVYTTAQSSEYTTSSPDYVPAVTANDLAIDIVWGYGHLWPLLDFYGVIYIPWYKTNGGIEENPTFKPNDIYKIRIGTNTKDNSRQEIKVNLFEIVDATYKGNHKDETWIGDVKVLHDFELKGDGFELETHSKLLDLTMIDPLSEDIVFSPNAKLYARKMTQEDYIALLEKTNSYSELDAWKENYSTTGQKFDYSFFDNGKYSKGLQWTYGSYLLTYDPTLNSYGALALSVQDDDWQGALGLTFWVKNPQNYPVSFNLEFSESEEGGSERWNLNSIYYKQIYAYNTVTGAEFSFNTLNVLYLPAGFEGWIRIPFSQYEVPSWSLANPWSDGVLDLSKSHNQIWITSQFVINDGITMYFDNIGLYYGEFEIGKLFDRQYPSIFDRLTQPFSPEA